MYLFFFPRLLIVIHLNFCHFQKGHRLFLTETEAVQLNLAWRSDTDLFLNRVQLRTLRRSDFVFLCYFSFVQNSFLLPACLTGGLSFSPPSHVLILTLAKSLNFPPSRFFLCSRDQQQTSAELWGAASVDSRLSVTVMTVDADTDFSAASN